MRRMMASHRLEEVIEDVDCMEAIGETCAVVDSAVDLKANAVTSVVVIGDLEVDSEAIEEPSVAEVMATGEEKVAAVDEAAVRPNYFSLVIHLLYFLFRLPRITRRAFVIKSLVIYHRPT
jgi:hypothetical protein